MTERARVLEIADTTVTVEAYQLENCESCSSSFCTITTRKIRAQRPEDLKLSVGDNVEVYLPPSKAIGAGFLVLIFPLLLFLAAYLAFGFLNNEGAQVGAGLGGLVLGFGLVYLFGKGRPQDLPKVVQVFPPSDFKPLRRQTSTV